MASSKAEIVIRVYPSRGGCTVQYSSKGRYISFQTAGYQKQLQGQPIQPTSSMKAFWSSVLGIVQADITATG
jgi:hypothetical protein